MKVMIQSSVILLLVMVVWVGCGEEDLGGVAKVMGTLPAIGSQIDSEGVLVITFDDSSNVEKGIITVTVHERGSLENGPSLPLVDNQATINYSGLVSGKVTVFIVSWKNTAGTVGTVKASFQVNEKKLVEEVEVRPPPGMVLIPKGVSSFLVGVDVNAFYMDKYEVTVGQFKKFVNRTGYEYNRWGVVSVYSPTDRHPMIELSWRDATAYCEWAGKRLPTEAEWEYAARGGLVDKIYSWGDDESVARDYANCEGIGGKDKWDQSTAPVGSLKPNGYGLFDMSGNVWEWCQDWYDGGKDIRVLRGGSWANGTNRLHVPYRFFNTLNNRYFNSGFRCVSRLN